ncbi:actin-like ATPase involved in cell division [Halobacteroides halobius DSM 5150]|uniref:Actin-like ATPase involved in cell division n=1 Tax=Halobacteroides halobius (strain ATCC 35273 / DSM 5150 / MD-1) TaxID=748449 RepID=L0KC62_HALHC|nr:cell division FtsA domain-containing protein [Halobacteroides halobius]AGB41959.1 actin-like ATPase involved in cell division [Halobacteroides halobius DSM 5150]
MLNILSILNNVFNKSDSEDYQYRIALDIGTEYVKAVVVKFDEQYICEIIGYGRVQQSYSNMDGGAVSNIEDVIKKSYEAIEEATEMAEVEPEEIVIGIAGEFVKGDVTTLNHKRLFSKRKLKRKELDNLAQETQKKALNQAREELLADTGLDNVKVQLINSSIVEIKLDGYKITNPEEFQGKNLELTAFNTFAPLVHIGALETIADRLGYKLVGIIAEPFAIAKSIMSNEAYEFGAIVIDIGGGTTDIALIRNGGIEGTKMFSLAGRAFTKTLAREFNLSLQKAEELKIAYSTGKLNETEEIDKLLKSDLNLLYEGIEVALDKLAQSEALPQKIYLCGGGSSLNGLFDGIQKRRMYENLPFFRKPDIKLLSAEDITGVKDRIGRLTGAENVTPKSLALQATMIQEVYERNIWDKLSVNIGR